MTDPCWIQTASGAAWDILNPKSQDVRWDDIAVSLAKICRFNGNPRPGVFYSVAQHCCLVSDIMAPEYRLYGLLHDAHEALLGDITAPMKLALRSLGAGDALEHLAEITDKAIFAAAGCSYYSRSACFEHIHAAVKQADMTMLATERRDLLSESERPWADLPEPMPWRVYPWEWQRAYREWMIRLKKLLPKEPAL